MLSRRDFIKLSGLGLVGAALPRCGGDDDDVGRAEFGFHLNPVLINGTGAQSFSGAQIKSLGSDPDTKYFSYETPAGIRYLPLPLENGLTKAYPTQEDYERIKRIGDFVTSNLWELYWNDPQDAQEMRNVIERCAGNALNLIIRLEDTTRIANHPNAGPSDEEWFVNTFEPYVRSVVLYAKGKVFAYQVWNEPNLAREWGGKPPDAAGYVELLKVCSEAIRAADPEAIIIFSLLHGRSRQFGGRTEADRAGYQD
ncbi:MAG: twin-arginine translocation signal domain-containing protein [Deltaproteobacteria bacterium]|nr:twin-arginine translocation signal domain-containing protein [Deltaproteobacteria bacterium]